MEEFLERNSGQLKHFMRGHIMLPPDNRTNWDNQDVTALWNYFRLVTSTPRDWNPNECVVAIAQRHRMQQLQTWVESHKLTSTPRPSQLARSNDTVLQRLEYIWADRKRLCLYDGKLASSKVLRLRGRYLVPFYAFVFSPSQDRWIARYVRDRLRYVDLIQGVAARIVSKLGCYDGFHVRRGDFWEAFTVNVTQIYNAIRQTRQLQVGPDIYVATDEYEDDFFHPLKQKFNLVFLGDFREELGDLDPNYYGMVEQLVLSNAKVFFGCYRSSFSSYVTRLRGYRGVDSYYFNEEYTDVLSSSIPIRPPFFSQEWTIGWAGISDEFA
jgi:hypothetical protein